MNGCTDVRMYGCIYSSMQSCSSCLGVLATTVKWKYFQEANEVKLPFIFKRWRFRELEQLEQLEQKVQRLEQTIREKTEEIRRKDQQLDLLSLQLKGTAENREEFKRRIYSIFDELSQEFRAALTLIMLPLERLLESCRDKEQEERLNLMSRNSQELLTLINRLSSLFNVFSGRGAGTAEKVGAADTVDTVGKNKENPGPAACEPGGD